VLLTDADLKATEVREKIQADGVFTRSGFREWSGAWTGKFPPPPQLATENWIWKGEQADLALEARVRRR